MKNPKAFAGFLWSASAAVAAEHGQMGAAVFFSLMAIYEWMSGVLQRRAKEEE